MESTFKKQYEVKQLADGSMQLSFKEKRIGAHQLALVTKLLLLGVIVGGFFATLMLTVGMMAISSANNIGMKFGFSAVLVTIGIVFLLKKLTTKQSDILVTKEGLIFQSPLAGKTQLAFRDVTDWGIKVESTSGDTYLETAYLYAHAGGQEFRVTKHMTPALAKSLHTEINRYVEKYAADN